MKLKRIGSVVAAAVIGLTGAVAITSPAQAARSDCFSGKLCLWQNIEYGGTLGMYTPSTSCYTMGVMNNAASSVYNRTSRTVAFYDGSGCSGSMMFSLASGFSYANLVYGAQGANWNDRITSFKYI